jgi:hypothetical protein
MKNREAVAALEGTQPAVEKLPLALGSQEASHDDRRRGSVGVGSSK